MELDKRIKQLRLKAGLTQEQLAEKLGISAQSVSKWENAVAMPDIVMLPLLSETFGVSIDELFDLSTEQRFNRIENRMDITDELPHALFWEYETFLKEHLSSLEHKQRATELLSYLYWHMMNAYARKTTYYAQKAIRLSPNEKNCQWMLRMAAGHATWDWNAANHTTAIEFYRGIVAENPHSRLAHYYLLDNLIADHRADEAEAVLDVLSRLKDTRPVLNEVYKAHIALARFEEKNADTIIEDLLSANPNDEVCLFEAAQYYAKKGDYQKAITLYEQSFALDSKRPRYIDALQGIVAIYQIEGDYQNAVKTYDRIIDVLIDEWGMSEEIELQHAKEAKARLLAKLQ